MRLLRHGSRARWMVLSLKSFSPPVGNHEPPTTPFSLKNVRRRLGDAAAWARRGAIASRKGRAMATPLAPRRRARRLKGGRKSGFMGHLLGYGRGKRRSG